MADKRWKNRLETAWHGCTRMFNAGQANACIRKHWSIENSLHYVRGVTLGEDASRIRTQPGTFARRRNWALNLLRFKEFQNIYVARQSLA